MKKEFLKFQVSKEGMNELRGGQLQRCHCGGTVKKNLSLLAVPMMNLKLK